MVRREKLHDHKLGDSVFSSGKWDHPTDWGLCCFRELNLVQHTAGTQRAEIRILLLLVAQLQRDLSEASSPRSPHACFSRQLAPCPGGALVWLGLLPTACEPVTFAFLLRPCAYLAPLACAKKWLSDLGKGSPALSSHSGFILPV